MANFIFGARQNSGLPENLGGANPDISSISPFLKPPLQQQALGQDAAVQGILIFKQIFVTAETSA